MCTTQVGPNWLRSSAQKLPRLKLSKVICWLHGMQRNRSTGKRSNTETKPIISQHSEVSKIDFPSCLFAGEQNHCIGKWRYTGTCSTFNGCISFSRAVTNQEYHDLFVPLMLVFSALPAKKAAHYSEAWWSSSQPLQCTHGIIHG